MNYNTYIVYDFETTGRNPHTAQITQIGAMAIHSRKLSLEPNGIFNANCKPVMDPEKQKEIGFGAIEDGALKVTGKTMEDLESYPDTKIVWEKFVSWVNKFNYKNSDYTSPIPVGYNINGYDSHLLRRYQEMYKTPRVFNNIWKVDLMDTVYQFTENDPKVKRRNLGAAMDWLGFNPDQKEGAHDAIVDVRNTANIFIKLQKFIRSISETTDFSTAFSEGVYIK